MVFSAKGLFLTPVPSAGATGQAGLTGSSGYFCCFFPFPVSGPEWSTARRDEKEKDNPPLAEKGSFEGGYGISGFLRRPKMALWPVQGYLSSSWRF